MRSNIGAFILGLLVAWVGLPALIHLTYLGLIVVAFVSGRLVH